MILTVACAIIAHAKRWSLVRDYILPSVLPQGFDEVVVVGNGEPGNGYTFLNIPPIMRTTIDSLVKRDAVTAATTSDWVLYLCDDHRLAPDFLAKLRGLVTTAFMPIFVPARYTARNGNQIELNSGAPDWFGEGDYCGGHAGVYPRAALRAYPWSCAPHDLNWDLTHSREFQKRGFQIVRAPELVVEDIEHYVNPESKPWL
jgi:hypothetical protein